MDESNLLICCGIALTVGLLSLHQSTRRRLSISRCGLPRHEESPWSRLFENGDDASFTSVTGFNRQSFNELHGIIFGNAANSEDFGRPTLMSTYGELGMILHFLNSSMKLKTICQIFGTSMATTSRTIKKMCKLLPIRLKENEKARVKFPNTDEMKYFSILIANREPAIQNAFGFLDGLSLPTQCSDDMNEQNSYYNGWHSDTTINNVLVFSPEGKIIFCSLNYPGSWHDATVSKDLYDKLHLCEYALLADSAFPAGNIFSEKILKPLQRFSSNPKTKQMQVRRQHAIVSLRQTAEWGMRAIQGSFGRLKCRMPSNKLKRLDILQSCILLHNFRTHTMGINQINAVFSFEYEQCVRDRTYDRISRYYRI
jgi:hypothetical protein